MMVLGEGRLYCGINREGIYSYDGVSFFGVLSLGLLIKIFRLKNKITIFTSGKFLILFNHIIWFKTNKKDIAKHTPIQEDFYLICKNNILTK